MNTGSGMPWKRIGWALPVLLLFVLLLRERQALAAFMVHWSEFEHENSCYFAPTINRDERRDLMDTLLKAKRRVAQFYGPLRGTATLIMADVDTLSRFTDNVIAVTHYLPTGAVIVFGPAGRNVDVMAHELAHAELFTRVGYLTVQRCLPTWFDEGLAVQFDERLFYSNAALAERLAAGWKMPALSQLDTRAEFFAGSRDTVRFHYAGARAAIERWILALGPEQVVRTIDHISCGNDLQAVLARIAGPAR